MTMMDYTNRDDILQMLLDIRNRPQRIRRGDTMFLAKVQKKYNAEVDLSFDESERLMRIWDRITEAG